MRCVFIMWFAVLVTSFSGASHSQTIEEAAEACEEAARLIRLDKLDAALDEANWCFESVKQAKQARTLSLLPDEVNGFIAGEVENEGMLGFSSIKRVYSQGGSSVVVSMLTADSGGLAMLATIGINMASGGKKLRVQKRTVFDNSVASGNAEFMVQLKSGGVLNFNSPTVASATVLEFVKAFPIEEIDKALGG